MPDYDAFKSLHASSQQSLTPDTEEAPELPKSSFMTSSLYTRLRQETKDWLLRNIELIQRMVPADSQNVPTSRKGTTTTDNSIYTGCGGNAYLHWRLSCFFKAEENKEKASFHSKSAVKAIECALSMCPKKVKRGEEIAFYIGSAGKQGERS